jgi:hypothetical protein
MLRECYDCSGSTGAELNRLHSIDYEDHRDRNGLRYTPRRAASQFERFLFPQCFPQEAARSPDFSPFAERPLFGRDIRHSYAVLLERH